MAFFEEISSCIDLARREGANEPMAGPIVFGELIEIRVPVAPSPAFRNAASLLVRELNRRGDFRIEITEGTSAAPAEKPALLVHLDTLETLPGAFRDHFDPPLHLEAYPDYAEHINLRTVEDQTPAEIFLICGSERALIFAVGRLIRGFRFESGSLFWETVNANYQPNHPLRGFFVEENHLLAVTDDEWEEWIVQTALWGNNWVGVPADCISTERLAMAGKWGIQTSLLIPVDVGSLPEFSLRSIWITPWSSQKNVLLSPSVLVHQARKFHLSCLENRRESELWLDCSHYDEDQLTDLFDILIMEENPFVKSLVCSSTSDSLVMLQREMPLSLQLVTLNTIDVDAPDMPLSVAGLYFQNAPLTYGALAVSIQDRRDVQFCWSMLSWSPQPSVGEMKEYLRFE